MVDLFTWGQSGRGVKLTAHHNRVPRSRMVKVYLHSPIRLHVTVLDEWNEGTALTFLSFTLLKMRYFIFFDAGISLVQRNLRAERVLSMYALIFQFSPE
jgi:hypothetical protein